MNICEEFQEILDVLNVKYLSKQYMTLICTNDSSKRKKWPAYYSILSDDIVLSLDRLGEMNESVEQIIKHEFGHGIYSRAFNNDAYRTEKANCAYFNKTRFRQILRLQDLFAWNFAYLNDVYFEDKGNEYSDVVLTTVANVGECYWTKLEVFTEPLPIQRYLNKNVFEYVKRNEVIALLLEDIYDER